MIFPQIIKPYAPSITGLRFNTTQSSKGNKEAQSPTAESKHFIHEDLVNTNTKSEATADESDNAKPTATPEELIKRSQEAEEQQEQDDQDNVQETTGVIEKRAREGIIYFGNLYPIAPFSSTYFSRALAFAFGLTESRVIQILTNHAIPLDFPIKFTKIIPRYKDGGSFARFTIDEDAPSIITVKEAESVMNQTLKANEYRPLFNPLRRIRSFSVLGVPWIEDLHRRVSRKVRVVFEGGSELNQETVYSVLRRYGPIKDITTKNDPKDPIKSAVVEYLYARDASTARNCVNSLVVQGTQIHITYIPTDGGINALTKAVMDHSRISIPIIIALLAAFAVFIFNPIRIFFIERKVTDTTLPGTIEHNPVVRWLRGITRETMSNINRYLHREVDSFIPTFESLWIERQHVVRQIRQWLQENVNTFIVVSGPRGNGKKDLVTKFVLKDRENILTIDCEQLLKAQNDPAFIRAAAGQLGYYPVFPWMNNIATYLDLIIQGLTGQKSGIAESTEQQFKDMLTTSIAAIKGVALKEYHNAVKDEGHRTGGANPVTERLTEEAYLQLHPEAKPVVVISHYLNRTDPSKQYVYKLLADFASILVQTNTAHVVFITNDVTYESFLTSSLPNRIFKVASVGDADSKDAKRFVLNQILEARRTEAQANAHARYNNGESEEDKKEDDQLSKYIAVDKAVAEKKEALEVAKMKEELKHEGDAEKEAQEGSLATRILSYTTGVFSSEQSSSDDTKSINEDIEASADVNSEDAESLSLEYPYLDYALVPLGGRLTDLQSFARRLKSGEKPLDAAEDMVNQSASEIYQMFLQRNQRVLTNSETPSSSATEWTQEQAWTIIKILGSLSTHGFTKERQIALADSGFAPGSDRGKSKVNKYSNISHDIKDSEPEISLSFFLQDPNFKTKEQQRALTALQQAEMISLLHEGGRSVAVKAGKPLFQAAFRALIDDKVLFAIQETALLNSFVTAESKKIQKYEDELSTLSTMQLKSFEIKTRIGYLEKKLLASHDKVAKYEDELKGLSNIMSGK